MYALFHRDLKPSRRGFSFDRARGHNPALWNVWRQTRINALHGASRSLMMGIHYRASEKPSLQNTAGKLDKREPEVPPAYNG